MEEVIMNHIVPQHVPEELVVDLDIYNLPFAEKDVQLSWNHFRGKGPLVYSPRNGGHWVAVDGVDIAAMFRNTKQFSSRSVTIPSVGGEPLLPLEADPPLHTHYRKTVMSFLTLPRINGMEADIRARTIALIEDLAPRGKCEFISEFALQLPLIIVLKMMDLPLDDRKYLHDLTEIFARHPDLNAKQKAFAELHDYLKGKIDLRRKTPGTDLISHLLSSDIEGRPFTADEVLSTCTMVTLAGLDTVAAMLGFIALFLARNPAQRHEIRDHPEQKNNIIQELLRRFATSNMGRIVTEDMTYKGVLLKQGDHIMLSPTLHNLDPDLFADPERVDFSRPPKHITFGSGAHTCAGAHLGRLEIGIFLEEWLSRIPDFYVDPDQPVRARSGPVNTIDYLCLKWAPDQ
jgi:cytochrome P450